MSWTRHLYDPVGAIARDTGILGGNRRVMTDAEKAQARGGGGQSARDPSRVHAGGFGGASGYRGQGQIEREPVMLADQVETPMAKPAPLVSDTKPVADPWKPGQDLGGGSQAAGIRMDATASPAATMGGGALSPASQVNTGASTAAAQVNNQVPSTVPAGYPVSGQAQPPIMSDYQPPRAPTRGRGWRPGP